MLEKEQNYLEELHGLTDPVDRARCLMKLSKLVQVEHVIRAREYIDQALETIEGIDDKQLKANLWMHAGNVSDLTSRFSEAIEFQLRAARNFQQINNLKGHSDALNNIGIIYSRLKQADRAEEHYKKAYRIKRQVGDKLGMAKTLVNIGVVNFGRNQYKEAAKWFSAALKVDLDQFYSVHNIAQGNLGRCYLKLGDYNKAQSYLEDSLEKNLENNWLRSAIFDLQSLGEINQERGNYDEAIDYVLTLVSGEQQIASAMSC